MCYITFWFLSPIFVTLLPLFVCVKLFIQVCYKSLTILFRFLSLFPSVFLNFLFFYVCIFRYLFLFTSLFFVSFSRFCVKFLYFRLCCKCCELYTSLLCFFYSFSFTVFYFSVYVFCPFVGKKVVSEIVSLFHK